MYRIGQLSELNEVQTEPWFTITFFDEFYEDAEKGYIDKDEYLEYLKSFIFERKYYNEIQFYKPVIQQSKIKIYLQNLINKIKIWKGR